MKTEISCENFVSFKTTFGWSDGRRQKIGNRNLALWGGELRDILCLPKRKHNLIGAVLRHSESFEAALRQVQYPVFGDSRLSAARPLAGPIKGKRRIRHLNEKQNVGGRGVVCIEIGNFSLNYGKVRLRLGLIGSRNRGLDA